MGSVLLFSMSSVIPKNITIPITTWKTVLEILELPSDSDVIKLADGQAIYVENNCVHLSEEKNDCT